MSSAMEHLLEGGEMKKLLVVMVFALVLVGCGSAPVFVEPAVVPVIETGHEKKALLTETITTIKGATLDANGKLVGGVVEQKKTELNPRMAELQMKMALIEAAKLQSSSQVVATINGCDGSRLMPVHCFSNNFQGGGYNTTYQAGGGLSYNNYRPPPPVERPSGRNTNY